MASTACAHPHAKRLSQPADSWYCPQCQAIWPTKRNKFNAKRTEVDGIVFDSAAESRRWQQLRAMEQNGEISKLRRQMQYPLDVDGIHICDYRSDFEYQDGTGKWVVEDVKGFRTDSYQHKKRLMLAVWGIEISEVTA